MASEAFSNGRGLWIGGIVFGDRRDHSCRSSVPGGVMSDIHALPLEQTLWTRADCGRFLRYTPSTMRKRVEKLPGYPKARRPSGHPRWIAAEVIAWLDEPH